MFIHKYIVYVLVFLIQHYISNLIKYMFDLKMEVAFQNKMFNSKLSKDFFFVILSKIV